VISKVEEIEERGRVCFVCLCYKEYFVAKVAVDKLINHTQTKEETCKLTLMQTF